MSQPAVQNDAAKPEEKVEVKNNRVFVGNVPFSSQAEDLKAFFAKASPNVVEAKVLCYPGGRSKGCGLVEFKTAADAAKAIKELNNAELNGRKLFIREDREEKGFTGGVAGQEQGEAPQADGARGGRGRLRGRGRGARGRGGRGRGRGRGGFNAFAAENAAVPAQEPAPAHPADGKSLFVGNLPFATNNDELKTLFSRHGAVVKAEIQMDRSGSRSRGFGLVTFQAEDSAKAAIAGLHDTDFQGRKIVVRVDRF